MEVADALYGVSMRGDGATTVVSQRIRTSPPRPDAGWLRDGAGCARQRRRQFPWGRWLELAERPEPSDDGAYHAFLGHELGTLLPLGDPTASDDGVR